MREEKLDRLLRQTANKKPSVPKHVIRVKSEPPNIGLNLVKNDAFRPPETDDVANL